MTTPFSALTTPLDGIQLIEASAGTGKTYTIASLFARLILEKALAVHQILVVTYTRAATEELKLRIWGRLQQIRQALVPGNRTADAFVAGVVQRIGDGPRGAGLIEAALADFDRAAIFTIHGFCQRVLQEHAFETGGSHDAKLVTDPSDVIRGVAEDFWRLNLYPAPPEFIAYAASNKRISDPRHFATFWSQLPPTPFQLIPHPDKPPQVRLDHYRQLIRQLRRTWRQEREQIVDLLQGASLNARLYGRLKPSSDRRRATRRTVVAALAEDMTRFTAEAGPAFPLFAGFEKFTRRRLTAATAKSGSPPAHPFFDACERVAQAAADLAQTFDTWIQHLNVAFVEFARDRLRALKQADNTLFYDDLLTGVWNGLFDKNTTTSDRLTFELKRKYKAALVDEFQDTDPVQYDIFKALFGRDGSLLCMIGDPKQSIYSFRGADIFAYLNAARAAESRHTLAHNYRSHPRLIQAVNTLFDNSDRPFIYDQIPYAASRPGPAQASRHPQLPGGLCLWYLLDDGGRRFSKTDAVDRILPAVAREVLHLAFGHAAVVAPHEIAVLVRTNRQARRVKSAFNRHGIPAVIHSTGNVFDTHEASDLKTFLSAVLEPTHERRLRAALVSRLLGVAGRGLLSDEDDTHPPILERWRQSFQTYRHLWRTDGLMAMCNRFLSEGRIRTHLLGQPDGERKLTNLLHLMDILNEAALKGRLTPRAVVRWLDDRIRQPGLRDEAHLLRLEKDDAAVGIATVHKSKGLEYQVVFCPFAWEGVSVPAGGLAVYHGGPGARDKVADMGSPDYEASRRKAAREALAESLRLLYVAVTRAKTRCYLVWGCINTADTSPVAHLLYPAAGAGQAEHPLHSLKQYMATLDTSDHLKAIDSLAVRSEGTVMPAPLAAAEAPAVEASRPAPLELTCRRFREMPQNRWAIASYSSMVSQRGAEAARDRDGVRQSSPPVAEGAGDPAGDDGGLYAFPRGTGAGLFFHELLEHLDFSQPDGDTRLRLISSMLAAHGFDDRWRGPVDKMIRQLRTVSLGQGPGAPVLAAVDPGRRISEMGFTLALKPFASQALRSAFETDTPARLPVGFMAELQRLPQPSMRGFLKGYIDLAFELAGRYYLVDWKSNYLGDRLQDYHRDALGQVMSDNTYYLQAYLYVLALDRYLRQRDPTYRYEINFGGVFYVFIRGIDAARGPDYGIAAVYPSRLAIERLGDAMAAQSTQ